MTTITYQQHPRPWPKTPVSTEPQAASTVWAVTLTPEDEQGEHLRKLPINARYAAHLATLPECLGASWSRTAVDAVFDITGDEDSALRLAFTRPAGIGLVGAHITADPSEWDWYQASAERLAREALGARHQCQGRAYCVCTMRGNELAEHHIIERGFILGAGAQL